MKSDMPFSLSHIKDNFWNAAAWGASAELRPWLRDHGSLTQRIQQRCEHFSVRNLKNTHSRIARDESVLLSLAPQQLAWSREVFLCADEQPVIFAHSTCAAKDLRGAWHAIQGMGNKPLGVLLFSHPLIERQPLHYKVLHAHNPLYQRASTVLTMPPGALWARRSLFYLHGAPLLVTEVFLPEILKLQLRIEN